MPGRPVACSLSDDELPKALDEYARAESLYKGTAHIAGGKAHIRLKGEREPLGAFLQSLVAREAQCCAFLQFEINEVHDGFLVQLAGEGRGRNELLLLVRSFFPAVRFEE